MDPVVLIVGKFRSGTSMVAQVVNRLGWHIGGTIPTPCPPTWRSDWEDPLLSAPMILGHRYGLEELQAYVAARRHLSRMLGFGGRIAIKSPYLALIWPAVIAAASPALVVLADRDEESRRRSLTAHPLLSEEDDRLISEEMAYVQQNVTIYYEDAISDPAYSVKLLAVALGVKDERTISEATSLIGEPTEYAPCLQ